MRPAWFRNALMYRLTAAVPMFTSSGLLGSTSFEMVNALNEALHTKPSREPDKSSLNNYGWADPYPPRVMTLADREEPDLLDEIEPAIPNYVRSISNGRYLLIMAREIFKVMPSASVKRTLSERVKEIEREQMRKVYKKERDQLKDDVIAAMLPVAFLNAKTTMAAIDTQLGLIYVDATSARRAEDLLSTLRECLGSLPIRPVTTKLRPSITLTDWVKKGKCTSGFHLLSSMIAEDTTGAHGSKVAMVYQDLTSEEAQLHTQVGKTVTKLALGYENKIGFLVDDKLAISKIIFDDLLQDQAAEDGGGDNHGQLDAGYFIMLETFAEAFPALLEALGGEEIPTGI